jgi:hypothetical protein
MTKVDLIQRLQAGLAAYQNRVGKSVIEVAIDKIEKGPAEMTDDEGRKVLQQYLKTPKGE